MQSGASLLGVHVATLSKLREVCVDDFLKGDSWPIGGIPTRPMSSHPGRKSPPV